MPIGPENTAMKPDIHPDDETVLNATRGFASRRLDIPPTPRDTLAVLRQAAEQQRAAARPGGLIWWRWAAATCSVLVLLLLAGRVWMPGEHVTKDLHVAAVDVDLGLDLVDWDLEVDALMIDLQTSLDAFTSVDAQLENLANALSQSGDTTL